MDTEHSREKRLQHVGILGMSGGGLWWGLGIEGDEQMENQETEKKIKYENRNPSESRT
jgi:hypothetical protein